MKTLSFIAITAVALLFVNATKSPTAQFAQGPEICNNTLTAKIAGLGNNELITIKCEGSVFCQQKNNTPAEGSFSKTIKAQTDENGAYDLSVSVRVCPGGFNLVSSNITVSVYEGSKAKGTPILSATAEQCN